MNKSQVTEAVYKGLSEILVPAGFKARKKDLSFKRSTESGYHYISFAVVDYNPIFSFTVVTAVRADAVEDVRNPFSGKAPQYWGDSVTAMFGEERFDGPLKFEVTSEAEIPRALEMVRERINGSILPFLDQHVTLFSVERLLNSRIDRSTCRPLDKHALAGVAAAAVCRRADYDEIVGRYRELVSGLHTLARQQFEDLVMHLSLQPNFPDTV